MILTVLCAGALRPAPSSNPPPSQSPFGSQAGWSPAGGREASDRFLHRLGKADQLASVRAAPIPGEPLPLESGEEAWCRARFTVQPDHTCAAAAAIELGGQPGALILRPVHLHAGLDHVVLDPPVSLDLSDAEARALFEAAVDWLAPEPIRLRYLSASLWELTETDPAGTGFSTLRGASAARASGRNIDIWLPRGHASRNWRRLMNEVQMLWHSHPVNTERERAGQKRVNALWLEGCTPASLGAPFSALASNDPVVRGLSLAAGVRPLPAASAAEVIAAADSQSRLIDLPFWRDALAEGSDDPWAAGWQAFDRWLASLPRDVSPDWLERAEVVLTGEHSARVFRWSRFARLRLWRGKAPATWLDDLGLAD